MSIDGFITGTNGEMDWMQFPWTEDLLAFVKEITDPVDTILLGRNLAEGFIPHYTLSVPSSSLEVHYTFVDGYLLAAPSQILIDRTLSLRESKLTIGSSAKFLSLLPNDGRTNFSAIFYQNATGIAGPLASLVTRFAHDLSPEEKQSIEGAGLELKPSLAYAYAEDDRILFAATSESSFGADLATLLGGALGIGHAGPGH